MLVETYFSAECPWKLKTAAYIMWAFNTDNCLVQFSFFVLHFILNVPLYFHSLGHSGNNLEILSNMPLGFNFQK